MASRRLLYHGKAVVSNLLNTGIVLVCEAMVDEGWVEVEVPDAVPAREVLTAYMTFVGLDDAGKPVVVPQLRAETPAERTLFRDHARAAGLLEREDGALADGKVRGRANRDDLVTLPADA